MASIATAFGAAAALKNGANPYKPLWLLLIESRQPTPSGSAAIREIRKRDASGTLSQSARHRILDAALAARRDESTKFNPLWADLIATHRELGKVSDADWIEFVKRGTRIEPFVKPKFRSGTSMPFSINYSGPELPTGGKMRIPIEYTIESVAIGGVDIGNDYFHSGDALISSTGGGRITWQITPKLAPGPTSADFRVSVRLLNAPKGHEIATWTITKTQRVVVAQPDEVIVPTRREPELAATIQSLLSAKGQGGMLMLSCQSPPRSLAFEVFARYPNPKDTTSGSATMSLGYVYFSRGEQSSCGLSIFSVPREAATVDLVLRPSATAAETSTATDAYWSGEDLVLTSVPMR
ncbi:MAG: hypothetical protein K2Y21_10540 [Phycisphaerales bacterium]|nr:hypothetical protein [Phycisphaerales bacterium]